MPNTIQKIALLDIDANIKSVIETKLNEGYCIMKIVNLQPSINKLLIIYTFPDWAE